MTSSSSCQGLFGVSVLKKSSELQNLDVPAFLNHLDIKWLPFLSM